jgi:hypothetical protein
MHYKLYKYTLTKIVGENERKSTRIGILSYFSNREERTGTAD